MASITDPLFVRDRYAFYQRLHAEGTVAWDEVARTFLIVGHDEVMGAFRAPQLSSRRVEAMARRWSDDERRAMEPLTDSLTLWMLFQDPPDHTRLRTIMTKAFTPRVVEQMRPRIEGLVRELLDAAAAKGGLDVIAELAFPLPATVILEMLGIPASDRDRFKAWSNDIARFVGGAYTGDAAERAKRSVEEMRGYFAPLFAARRASPREDLISALLAATDRHDVKGDDELLANCVMLMFGGHETTTNLIGNGALALLEAPEERARFVREPALGASAIDELLRYDAPVQMMRRTAAEDVVIGGVSIATGSLVALVIGAANRDPKAYDAPERLDLARKPRHAAFGMGPHFCVGAALARMEGEIALRALFTRFPALRRASDDEPAWQPSVALRALAELRVVA